MNTKDWLDRIYAAGETRGCEAMEEGMPERVAVFFFFVQRTVVNCWFVFA